jgi:hypothetical protein
MKKRADNANFMVGRKMVLSDQDTVILRNCNSYNVASLRATPVSLRTTGGSNVITGRQINEFILKGSVCTTVQLSAVIPSTDQLPLASIHHASSDWFAFDDSDDAIKRSQLNHFTCSEKIFFR